jgi:hypothetical protein
MRACNIRRSGRHVAAALIFLVLGGLLLQLSGCLVRRRVVAAPGKPTNRTVLSASKDELIKRVRAFSDGIQSFSMTADLSASVGAIHGGEVTDYATIRGYLFYRGPDDIRILGLDPVIRSKAFDMLSTGSTFQLLLPSKNRLISGRNDVRSLSDNKLENLRPTAFLVSLLIMPPDPAVDFTLLEDDTDELHAQYELLIVNHGAAQPFIERSIYFDRYTLQIARQRTFDTGGEIVSDTRYGNWKAFSGQNYPSSIDINRPREGYSLGLEVEEFKINPELAPDQFTLTPPPGVEMRQLK